ncbi:hypothetical protein BDV27DRAFT_85096 [Aspergillus caelatus]|uniref:Uncharacterized protein n=2 Tax=Aspergillus subgen. Circumdati TaxID=2720871 RepID=A0A5N6ZJ22_9EURO|nr:uncharacterized protein BDV27DRAFT_85096 [Aspergillus caelatus]KAE8357485.1 hypothetical protein BDV27DRAFT_85096 [Aspergillus caelatus]KAE8410264.1 hypothetical protein BDV36DRAFT_278387 [Aspergillus pseudocaelatus]
MTHFRRSVVRSLQHLHYIWALGFHSFPEVVQLFWHSMALLSFLLVSQVWVFGIVGWMAKEKCAVSFVWISDALWFTCALSTLRPQADFVFFYFGSTSIGRDSTIYA